MIKNFFKTTLRNFSKNRTYLIINLVGLSLSLACCIVGYLNFEYAYKFDHQHENLDKIYKIQVKKDLQGNKVPFGITPLALGKAIQDKRSEIAAVSRYAGYNIVTKKNNVIFEEHIAFVDSAFLSIFTYPVKYGSSTNLYKPGTIILSSQTSEKYFGEKDPTGELLKFIMSDGTQHSIEVGGVLEKLPQNMSMRMDGLMIFDNYDILYGKPDNSWGQFIAATFIMLKENRGEISNIENWLNSSFIDIQNRARNDWLIDEYYGVSFDAFADQAEYLRSQWLSEPPPKPAVLVPFIMAILLLLIACFNFTNTAIATSSKRLKEIGIRKVMGGNKKQLVVQFMGENALLTLIALLIAIGISFFLVPAYSALWDFIDLKLDLIGNPEIFLFLGLLLIFTSAVAGIYPSLYISSFAPVTILRGGVKVGKTSALSKVLLGSQFGLTIIGLVASIAFTRNATYQESLYIGYDKNDLVAITVDNTSEYERLSNRIKQLPDLSSVAGTQNHLGTWTYGRTLSNASEKVEAGMMNMSREYLDVVAPTLLKGRLWTQDLYQFDLQNSIIVNETLVSEFGWTDPLGKMVQIDDSTKLSVVGVIKDIHVWGFFDPIEPLGIRPAKNENYNFVIAKTQPGLSKKALDEIETIWNQVVPDKPYNAWTQDVLTENTEMVNNNITLMFGFIGFIALILSIIGLYTLVSLSVIKRVKEIGVRKVLGANIAQIIKLMNLPFFWLLIVAATLGSAISFFAIGALLESVFAYHKTIDLFTIGLPMAFLVFISLLISSVRIYTAANQNPVTSLRYE